MSENEIPKWSLQGRQAIQSTNEAIGFDITKVLSDNDWCVFMVDGNPEVVMDVGAVSKVALFAPDQDLATRFVNELDIFVKENK